MRGGEGGVPDGDIADLAVEETGISVTGTDVPVRGERYAAHRVRAACKKLAVLVQIPVHAVVRADEVDPRADVFRGNGRGDRVSSRLTAILLESPHCPIWPNAPHVPSFVRPRAGNYYAMVGVVREGTRHGKFAFCEVGGGCFQFNTNANFLILFCIFTRNNLPSVGFLLFFVVVQRQINDREGKYIFCLLVFGFIFQFYNKCIISRLTN